MLYDNTSSSGSYPVSIQPGDEVRGGRIMSYRPTSLVRANMQPQLFCSSLTWPRICYDMMSGTAQAIRVEDLVGTSLVGGWWGMLLKQPFQRRCWRRDVQRQTSKFLVAIWELESLYPESTHSKPLAAPQLAQHSSIAPTSTELPEWYERLDGVDYDEPNNGTYQSGESKANNVCWRWLTGHCNTAIFRYLITPAMFCMVISILVFVQSSRPPLHMIVKHLTKLDRNNKISLYMVFSRGSSFVQTLM